MLLRLANGNMSRRTPYTIHRMTVAEFNQRAIALYSHAGFRTLGSFIKINGETQMEFLVMER